MMILPFTAAMIMPADVSLGVVSPGIIAASLVCMIAFIMAFVILAGRIYKMMSLYKGNKVSIREVLIMTFSKNT
jgi:ABC-type Na+ efflux pump permease subunit